MVAKYLRVMGLYLTGVVIVIIGLYMLFGKNYEYGSFMFYLTYFIMFSGLFITGGGAIHGKRVLRRPEYMGMKTNISEASMDIEETEHFPVDPQPTAATTPAEQPTEQKQTPTKPLVSSVPTPMPASPTYTTQTKAFPAERVVKVLICPKCFTENREDATFCYKCGKKLRKKGN